MGSGEYEAIVEEQFFVGDSPALSLDTVSGRVTIRRSSQQTIRICARKHGRSHVVENTRIQFSHEGDVVNVHTMGAFRQILGDDSPCSVDFDVSVPRGCRIHVETVNAEIDIREIGAAVNVKTVSGCVYLNGASESSSIPTVSGDFAGHSLEGTLHLRAVSGSIVLETTLIPIGRYRAQTVSGSMRLQVPDGTGITVHTESVSGRIHSDLPSTVEKIGFGNWEGKINGGGAEFHLDSVIGSVTITQSGAPVPA